MTKKIVFLALFISSFSWGNELKFSLEKTNVIVHSISSYESTDHLEGVNEADVPQTFYFSIAETEKLVSITGTYTLNGKAKKFNFSSDLSISTINWSSVFNGLRTYSFTIPGNAMFQFEYKTSSNETIFLSDVFKNGLNDATDFFYEIQLPIGLELSTRHRTDKRTGNVVFTNSDFKENETRIYYLIHPKGIDPSTYLNDWFLNRIQSQEPLNKQLLPADLLQLAAKGKSPELAKACFQYVQKEIQYLDIENGLNALIPRPANQTISNKYGDCKDMALLLHQLLTTFGFESYLSISKTSSKQDSFDFPSISMANHMIVSLHLNNEYYFLDATEKECSFGDPSLQIIGTEAFLIQRKEAYFQVVPKELRFQPSATFDYFFRLNDGKPSYTLTMKFTEKFNLLFQHLTKYNSADEKTKQIIGHLIPYAHQVDSVHSTEHETSLFISSTIPTSYFNQINNQCYLDLKALPDLNHIFNITFNEDSALFKADITMNFHNLKFKPAFNLEKGIDLKSSNADNNYIFHVTPENSGKKGELLTYWKSYILKPAIIQP
jgi:hypothetical protein